MQAREILIPLGFFLLVFAMLFIYIRARNAERLALIEKGADASMFTSGRERKAGKFVLLKIGLFFIGGSVGVLAGYFVSAAGMADAPAYLSMIFMFAGLGLVASYPISKRME